MTSFSPVICESPPHAGAWIETRSFPSILHLFVSPRHAGAWIETLRIGTALADAVSPPHAGAWIETIRLMRSRLAHRVAPSRGGVD